MYGMGYSFPQVNRSMVVEGSVHLKEEDRHDGSVSQPSSEMKGYCCSLSGDRKNLYCCSNLKSRMEVLGRNEIGGGIVAWEQICSLILGVSSRLGRLMEGQGSENGGCRLMETGERE